MFITSRTWALTAKFLLSRLTSPSLPTICMPASVSFYSAVNLKKKIYTVLANILRQRSSELIT